MFSTQCPDCGARFQIKNDAILGEVKPCPKCRKPFELSPAETDEGFGPRLPPRRSSAKRASSKSTGKRRRQAVGRPLLLWIAIGGIGLLVIAVGGYFAVRGLRSQTAGEVQTPTPTETATLPAETAPPPADAYAATPTDSTPSKLRQARAAFQTTIIKSGEPFGPPDAPPSGIFDLVHYQSPAGSLAAYLTPDPADGQKHPAIVWITGGDCNSIGDVWSPSDRSNDQSARAFREAGVVMMFPSLRGGNDNPGRREGFYGEVDDILAAADRLAGLSYVDPQQLYLGGHSTGGTMVLLVAECTDRFRAIFSLGPVATPAHYGGDFVYADLNNDQELSLRSPIDWLDDVRSPTYVFEGANQGNWRSISLMDIANINSRIRFLSVPQHDHFSVIAPLTERLAAQVVAGKLDIKQQTVEGLR